MSTDLPPLRRRLSALVNPGTILAAVLLIVLGAAAWLLARRLEVPLFSAEGATTIIDAFGPWAPVVFILVLALTVVVSHLPGVPLAIAAGAVWGSVIGAAISVAGGLLGAIAAYLIGRNLGGSLVYLFSGRRVSVTGEKAERVAGLTIFVARLIPLMPFDVVSYGAGLARVPFGVYLAATAAGMAPSTFLLTYLGDSFTGSPWLTITLSAVAAVAFVVVPIVCSIRRPKCFRGLLSVE